MDSFTFLPAFRAASPDLPLVARTRTGKVRLEEEGVISAPYSGEERSARGFSLVGTGASWP